MIDIIVGLALALVAGLVGWYGHRELVKAQAQRSRVLHDLCKAKATEEAKEVISEIDSKHTDDRAGRIAAKADLILSRIAGKGTDTEG